MKLPQTDLQQTTEGILGNVGRDLAGRSILITGGTGFVGRTMVETFCAVNAAADLGARIYVLTRDADGFRSSAPHLVADPAVTILRGDVRVLDQFSSHLDFVIHGATASSARLAAEHPRRFVETIDATRIVAECAVRSGATRFLYLSSGAVYGGRIEDIRISEDYRGAPDPLESQSAYAETKRAGEWLCAAYGQRFGLEAVVARGFSFIGPHLPLTTKFAAGEFLRAALDGQSIEIQGDGTPLRSYLYTSDLAIWLWVLLLRGRGGRAYNVGSEDAVSIADLAREAASFHDPPLPVLIRNAAVNAGVARYVPSTERARNELGLRETIDWRSGLRKTYEWHRAARKSELNTENTR